MEVPLTIEKVALSEVCSRMSVSIDRTEKTSICHAAIIISMLVSEAVTTVWVVVAARSA